MSQPSCADRLERLEQHPRRSAMQEAAWLAASAAVDLGNRHFPEQPSPASFELPEEDAATAAGNAAAILRQGASGAEQRQLVADLVLLAAARDYPSAPETELETARRLVWLEAHTSLRLLAPLVDHLGERAASLGAALTRATQPEVLRREGEAGPAPRGELLVVAAALASFPPEQAARLPSPSASLETDEAARRLLERSAGAEADFLEGELGPPPRGPWLTALLAITLWLFISHLLRLLARWLLGYRTPARARLTDRGLELETRSELFGRTLRARSFLVPLAQLAFVEREVRFARAAFYAGLGALVLGTYIGAGFLVDGLRAPGGSATLIGFALLLIVLGVGADFAVTSLSAGLQGRCRVVIRPRQGRRFAMLKVDPDRAEAMLRRLASAAQAT